MTCHFDHGLVVTWALPAQALEPLVPPGLDLDTYDGRRGFVSIALVQTDIDIMPAKDRLAVRITSPAAEADLHVVARLTGQPAALPPSSPFRSDRDARRFGGPLPWTFDYEPQTRSIVMIRGRRSQWRPRQVAVDVKTCGFLEQAPFAAARPRLASAFRFADLDYGWDRGIRVPAGQP